MVLDAQPTGRIQVVRTWEHQDGISYSNVVRQQLQVANFKEVEFRLTARGMGIGLHCYRGDTAPLPTNEHVFVLSGMPDRAVAPT